MLLLLYLFGALGSKVGALQIPFILLLSVSVSLCLSVSVSVSLSFAVPVCVLLLVGVVLDFICLYIVYHV